MSAPRDTKALRQSQMFYDAPDEARKLWAQGYRPVEARALRPAMMVAYRATDVFQLNTVGPVLFSRVETVTDDSHGSIRVSHTAGVTDCDELDEVWAKPNDDPDYRHWEEL